MRRLALLAATTLSVAVGMMTAPSAMAASTCAIHQAPIVQWSIQADQIGSLYDFQCGGANNDDYHLGIYLQYQSQAGSWFTAPCENGLACSTQRPTTGYYNGGNRRSGTNMWNAALQIDCRAWRMHVLVAFRSGGVVTFNGPVSNIGGC